MSKKEQLKESIELVGIQLRKAQVRLSELDKEIYNSEEAIEKAKVVMEVDPSLSLTMERRVKAAVAITLKARREEAVLLEQEGKLSQHKLLLEQKFYANAQKILGYKQAQKALSSEETQDGEEEVVETEPTPSKSYDDVMRDLRLLRDSKLSSGSNLEANLSKEKVKEELECVEELIEKSNEWFKENGRDNPGFKSQLADAEYLFNCKKELDSIL